MIHPEKNTAAIYGNNATAAIPLTQDLASRNQMWL